MHKSRYKDRVRERGVRLESGPEFGPEFDRNT
jgi:hypothetical protein